MAQGHITITMGTEQGGENASYNCWTVFDKYIIIIIQLAGCYAAEQPQAVASSWLL